MNKSCSRRAVMQFFVGAGHGTLSAAKPTIYYFLSATNACLDVFVFLFVWVFMRMCACVLGKWFTNIFVEIGKWKKFKWLAMENLLLRKICVVSMQQRALVLVRKQPADKWISYLLHFPFQLFHRNCMPQSDSTLRKFHEAKLNLDELTFRILEKMYLVTYA